MVQRRSGLARPLHTARWLAHTPWPVLALDVLRANLIGALFTFAFLRYGMPTADAFSLGSVNFLTQVTFAVYLLIAVLIGMYASIKLSMPVLIWHRRRSRLDDEAARKRALQLPTLVTVVTLILWAV